MARPLRTLALGLLIGALGVPQNLTAQGILSGGGPGFLLSMPRATVGVRGNFDLRLGSAGPGDFYDFVTSQLTLNRRDFDAFGVGADLDYAVAGPFDLSVGAGYSVTGASSEFRDWVDQNDQPIRQDTKLTTTTVTAAVRWNLAARGRQIGEFVWIPARVVPYVGAGGGAMRYRLRQAGYFVDARDLSIFGDQLTSDGWTGVAMIMAGTDYGFGKRWLVRAEARYLWATAPLSQDFVGFAQGLDLSGLQLGLGFHVRL